MTEAEAGSISDTPSAGWSIARPSDFPSSPFKTTATGAFCAFAIAIGAARASISDTATQQCIAALRESTSRRTTGYVLLDVGALFTVSLHDVAECANSPPEDFPGVLMTQRTIEFLFLQFRNCSAL
jgi:hypothetical protein